MLLLLSCTIRCKLLLVFAEVWKIASAKDSSDGICDNEMPHLLSSNNAVQRRKSELSQICHTDAQ